MKATTDDEFYGKFKEAIVEKEGDVGDEKISQDRLAFHAEQYKMIPSDLKDLFCNIARVLPTPPVYAFFCYWSSWNKYIRMLCCAPSGCEQESNRKNGGIVQFHRTK